MKDIKKILIFLIMIIFVSIGAGYVAGFYAYKDYKNRIDSFDEQAKSAMNKFLKIEEDLKNLYAALDENSIERRKVLSRLDEVKSGIKEWKSAYHYSISELRTEVEGLKVDRLSRKIDNLQDELEDFRMKMQDLDLKVDAANSQVAIREQDKQSVDLGRVSVKK